MRGPVVIDTDEDPDEINDRQRSVILMTRGFHPHWANRAWIHSRAESVFEIRALPETPTVETALR